MLDDGPYKRSKITGESFISGVQRRTHTVDGFIKKIQQNILENTWQVIQVSFFTHCFKIKS